MVFYDKTKHGSMKQYTIITQIEGGTTIKAKQHDQKVDTFNSEHTVFFNQSNSMMMENVLTLVTVCLYADGLTTSNTSSGKKGVV